MEFKCKIGLHSWDGCKCSECGKVRNKHHVWIGCVCSKCHTVSHTWDGAICLECGTIGYISESEMIEILRMEYQKSGGSLRFSKVVKHIGRTLNRNGGYEKMLQVANEVVANGVPSWWMNEAWDKIGKWRS